MPPSTAGLNGLDVEVKIVDELTVAATVVPASVLVATLDGGFAVEVVQFGVHQLLLSTFDHVRGRFRRGHRHRAGNCGGRPVVMPLAAALACPVGWAVNGRALELLGREGVPGEPPVRALDDVSLQGDHGRLDSESDQHPARASPTLLNVVGTLDRPTSRVVAVDGIDTATRSEKEVAGVGLEDQVRLSTVFLLPGMSAGREHVSSLLFANQQSHPERGAEGRSRRLKRRTRPSTSIITNHLSGGERQQVAVARALVHHPPSCWLASQQRPRLEVDDANDRNLIQQMISAAPDRRNHARCCDRRVAPETVGRPRRNDRC